MASSRASSGFRRAACTLAVAAALASSLTSTAQAQNFLERPHLGKPCSQEGSDCTADPSRRYDVEFDVQWDLFGENLLQVWAMKRPDFDPNALDSWLDTRFHVISSPEPDILLNNVPMRIVNPVLGYDGWLAGGLGRGVATRYDFGAFFSEHLEARFRDAGGTLRPYPGAWNLAGQTLHPSLNPINGGGRAVFLLADDSVTPADNAKLGNFLVTKGLGISDRLADTRAYYRRICGDVSAFATTCLNASLNTLTRFRQKYGMQTVDGAAPAPGETVAVYHNKGDLGIGREMHCRQHPTTQDIACYVKNFGDFGAPPQWSSTGFQGSAFATVAMVERHAVSPTSPDKVIFLVYGSNGQLAMEAPLDQHAKNALGVNGTNYNAHIPTNCMSCHGAGGTYVPQNNSNVAARGATGAMFLPFDLDQFEYNPLNAAQSRASQETAFRILNIDVVRRVAHTYGTTRAGAIINTVNGWYGINPEAPHQEHSLTFLSNYLPPGWAAELWDGFYGDHHFYQKVIRPYCRGCHMTFSLDDPRSFESWDRYDTLRVLSVNDVCPPNGATPRMPHAEQVSREFWRSDARAILVAYNTWTGDQIKDCVPGANR